MSLSALILTAAAEVGAHEEEETSKTAFYVAGAVLAGYAVLLAGFGIANHSFPGSKQAVRGVCAFTAVLVAAAMAAAILTS